MSAREPAPTPTPHAAAPATEERAVSNGFHALLREWRRPWKLFSLACGIALLIAGAYHYDAPDWDIPISLIMATLAYLTAAWSLRALLERRWRLLPLALFWTWFTVDGCYWLYWRAQDPFALEAMRSANFPASLSLYGMCGLVWLYRGTLTEALADARRVLRGDLSRR